MIVALLLLLTACSGDTTADSSSPVLSPATGTSSDTTNADAGEAGSTDTVDTTGSDPAQPQLKLTPTDPLIQDRLVADLAFERLEEFGLTMPDSVLLTDLIGTQVRYAGSDITIDDARMTWWEHMAADRTMPTAEPYIAFQITMDNKALRNSSLDDGEVTLNLADGRTFEANFAFNETQTASPGEQLTLRMVFQLQDRSETRLEDDGFVDRMPELDGANLTLGTDVVPLIIGFDGKVTDGADGYPLPVPLDDSESWTYEVNGCDEPLIVDLVRAEVAVDAKGSVRKGRQRSAKGSRFLYVHATYTNCNPDPDELHFSVFLDGKRDWSEGLNVIHVQETDDPATTEAIFYRRIPITTTEVAIKAPLRDDIVAAQPLVLPALLDGE